ncbi:NADP-dependent 3-hydroxy acid dehydrogenase YdfG [Kribbella sp. VKM Ac-2527]|uniref:NADP-dependent 3-hydroxy acid dehydrogenase YdfG n=1 Tax=Kribbella caucasensis TaxID=2512215 RepID=A0A4R6JJJ4_9ACTN|nr:SDR family oxidoreductase [Kribbella sp. VKM Ac-2527]TDO35837.1 NADP-dependent 3-hydroxy acid dehydrogenase YdfG [Kribbella sp. VKM Ac-2527]
MTNRVALITGAASGIGAAIATRLAHEGAAVALLARRADRLEKLAARIVESGGTAIAVPADVVDEESVAAAAAQVQERLGDIDLLVNNAGLMKVVPFEALPAEQWRRLIDVNVNGMINVTRIFLPTLKRSAATKTTDLVNVSSIAGERFMAGMATYGASKAALTYLSRALRIEVAGDGIRVTNLEPGMTGGTELADEFPADLQAMVDEIRTSLPAIQADEVADLVAYVVSRPRNVNLSRVVIQPAKEI